MKPTLIHKNNMTTLRNDATKAIQDVMAKHGLTAVLGRILFEPGREFRCKLTVMQQSPDPSTKSPPVVGESWRYGTKTYRIMSVGVTAVIGQRATRTQRYGVMQRSYRIKLDSLMATGYKV